MPPASCSAHISPASPWVRLVAVAATITAAISWLSTSRSKSAFGVFTPSYAFVGEPQTNGVIERFFRYFKEQVVHGHIYQTIDDVRDAVRAFVTRYNAEWLIEKNGHASPNHARATWGIRRCSSAAA